MSAHVTPGAPLTILTGTFVLSFGMFDVWADALHHVNDAAANLLQKYLTRSPEPGTLREDVAAGYDLSVRQLQRRNRLLVAAGLLMQARRQVGRGLWQHLIVAVSEPALMPAKHEAWDLLDASLAAAPVCGQVGAQPEADQPASCAEPESSQVTTWAEKPHIEPVNNVPPISHTDHKPSVVRSVGELRRLADLPPLPAPTDMVERGQDWQWRTPAQVLDLGRRYGQANLGKALAMLGQLDLPFYLADEVLTLMAGLDYGTDQLARVLAGVHDAEHPYAVARWRLLKLMHTRAALRPPPERGAWRAPSTTWDLVPMGERDPAAATDRGAAAAREAMEAARRRKRYVA